MHAHSLLSEPYFIRGSRQNMKKIKILFWNVRGMANPNTQSELANLCFTYSPDYLCTFEPMVSLSSIHSTFWNSIRMKFVCSNDRGELYVGF